MSLFASVSLAVASSSKRAFRYWLAGYAGLLTLLVVQASDRHPYDDSYFFKRFALNFLDHGVFAWNVADGPVYGNTSQLHQLVVTLVTALTRTRTFVALRVLLAAALLVGMVRMLLSARRYQAHAAVLLAFCSPVMLFCALSGMETCVVFALMAVFLAVIAPGGATRRHWALAPSLCVVLWLARPDTPLLTVPAWFVASYPRNQRGLLLIAGGIGLCLLAFKSYYGTALPLPFYAKQRAYSPYDAHFLELSSRSARERFSVFVWASLPLWLMALARRDKYNCVLLLSALAFVLYHWFTTIDVMGMQGRFYVPALPHLIFAASRSEQLHASSRLRFASAAVYLLVTGALFYAELPPVGDLDTDDNLTPVYYQLGTLAGVLVLIAPRSGWLRTLLPPLVLGAAIVACAVSFHPKRRALRSDNALLSLHEKRFSVYRGLQTLRNCFGEAIHVYHSEVGVVGLRFQAGKVTDLAGLLSPDWLFRKVSFDDACRADRPEGLFLPHSVYRTLNEEIQAGKCIKRYKRVIEESSSPLYIRKDLYRRYAACEHR